MPAEFPPQPSRRLKLAVGVALLVTLAYSFVVAGQILLWFLLVGVAAGLYLAWLLVVAVFRLVRAIERIAAAMEANADGDSRDRDPTGGGDRRGRDVVEERDD